MTCRKFAEINVVPSSEEGVLARQSCYFGIVCILGFKVPPPTSLIISLMKCVFSNFIPLSQLFFVFSSSSPTLPLFFLLGSAFQASIPTVTWGREEWLGAHLAAEAQPRTSPRRPEPGRSWAGSSGLGCWAVLIFERRVVLRGGSTPICSQSNLAVSSPFPQPEPGERRRGGGAGGGVSPRPPRARARAHGTGAGTRLNSGVPSGMPPPRGSRSRGPSVTAHHPCPYPSQGSGFLRRCWATLLPATPILCQHLDTSSLG